MGGNRAKERRRLKRQGGGASGGDEGAKGKDDKNQMATASTRDSQQQQQQQQQRTLATKHDQASSLRGKSIKKQGKQPISANENQGRLPLTSKSKVKKPKHLKRKLETVSDTVQKEALQQEWQDYERKKEALKAKKQKVERKRQRKPSSANVAVNAVDQPTQGPNQSVPATKTIEKQSSILPATKANETPPENSNSDDRRKPKQSDSDDSSVEDDLPETKRQRGKRRRGRKDTSKKVQESATVQVVSGSDDVTKGNNDKSGQSEKNAATRESKPKKDASRYCVGRKPITDFVVGQTYAGKVIYVKPFGVFLDINAHSDAFCHVSRVQDEYVEDPTTLFHQGDEVQARVVEIDRKQKRITVSMQSEEMVEMERKSIESRKERKEKRTNKSKKSNAKRPVGRANECATKQSHIDADPAPAPEATIPKGRTTTETSSEAPETKPNFVDPSQKSHADLKRERKLARRADRRAKSEVTDTTPASQ